MPSVIDNILGICSDQVLIKEGGQKKVYSCIHPNYGKVAVKIGKYSSTASLERIKREVQFLKSIKSDFFPENYDFILDLNESKFLIIEEFIDSIDYEDVKKYYNTEARIVNLIIMLINSLKILWDKNIVHRDLKPDNILFLKDYSPIIIDLGIARFLDNESITNDFAFSGPCTPLYSTPEQLLNKKDLIDLRTDFFLIGIIALELFLGYHPFLPNKVGNVSTVPENIVNGKYVRPESLNASKEFAYLINNLLSVQPYKRFRDYNIFLEYVKKNWS